MARSQRFQPHYSLPLMAMRLLLSIIALLIASASSSDDLLAPTDSVITIAAGCFWSVELFFQRLPGVVQTQVGYTGGHVQTGSIDYERVLTGDTGHAESVRVAFDPAKTNAHELYRFFFDIHDATTLNRQLGDHGTQYRSAIFVHNDEQRKAAHEAMEEEQAQLKRKIVTQIVEATQWWPAEDYHQKYLEKGGQDSTKGSLRPIQCYGNSALIKNPELMLTAASKKLLLGTDEGEL
uniref:peptide-methionine (S)-S-oxide reductase n=1 Tax=Craspedostauros australis TaxID=1486917 RepID=A0A7R9WND9_9STRA|mmetsp:Transcript_10800/g.29814  ORF Transcript_10800/g.29814 Transcript_10800/m.29814 type:complete len:236 (+) Transcript_10800:58-765(+)